jgi:uncharacterized repeat protein (TIGR03843 family)
MTSAPVAADLPAEFLDALLSTGTLDVRGRLAGSSNGTLLSTATLDGVSIDVVYKPVSGERPLWDFPDGTLGHREVAASVLADLVHALDPAVPALIPTTRWREDGPYGPGACQVWIHDAAVEAVDIVTPDAVPAGWRTVLEARDDLGRPVLLVHADDPRLRRMALLDAIANNSDRKGGHVLSADGALVGVDHGLCFNVDDKLRTVLWGWAGAELTDADRHLLAALPAALAASPAWTLHLTDVDRAITVERIQELVDTDCYPVPSGEWPAIPWPAF